MTESIFTSLTTVGMSGLLLGGAKAIAKNNVLLQ